MRIALPPPDPSTPREEPEVKNQPTAESYTSNLTVPELSVSENSSACSSDPGAEGTPTAPLVSENSSVSDNVSENSSVPEASSAATSVAHIHPHPPLHGLKFVINLQQYISSLNLLIRGPLEPLL